MNNINYKKKHLIEYLVYGLSDINNQDILPEGNVVSFLDNIENDLRRNITEYIKMLLNPSKIKIVFFLKYKILLTAKYVKKYFHYLTTKEKPKDNKIDKYKFEIKKFNLSQIFYIKANNNENNYIQIIFYVDKIKNESYIELLHKANYLNYIIDFINEKKNGSLYYLLTNTSNHNVKSISSGFDIIFKSKIEFYITIELNCFENINNIIFLTYQYIDTIIKQSIGDNMQMDRYKELKNKFNKDLQYSDKTFDTIKLAKVMQNFYLQKDMT